MNISSINQLIGYIKSLLDTKNPTYVSVSETNPKPDGVPYPHELPFETASPESVGISSEALLEFLKKEENDETMDMHNVMIFRHGKLICDCSYRDQDSRLWKQTYSACKSIVSIACGFAVEEGYFGLEDKLTDIFADEITALTRATLKEVTVEDLLTMTSTVTFNEAEAVISSNWSKCFFTSTVKGTHGVTFNYNSLNTYMLAYLIRKKTGMTVSEYLKPRLFDPLDITDYYWELSDEGVEKGGWGLYIYPYDLAKIGLCFLNTGKYNGKQIIPKFWIETAAFKKAEPSHDFGRFNYGYQMWCGRDSDTFLFNGMFGQNVLGFRDIDVLVVTNGGNCEMFQQSHYFDDVLALFSDNRENTLIEECADSEYTKALYGYVNSRKIEGTLPYPTEKCNEYNGLSFSALEDANAPSTGLLPLALQIVYGEFTNGLVRVSFEIKENGRLYVNYLEKGTMHRIPVGFDRPAVCRMKFGALNFRVSVFGEFKTDEDDTDVLKLRLAFLETPYVRRMKIFFEKDGIKIVHDETPTTEFGFYNAHTFKAALSSNPLLKRLEKIDDDYINFKVAKSFAPVVKLKKI